MTLNTRFDWCLHNQCNGCPGTVIRFHVDEKNRTVVTGQSGCGCDCHQERE